MPLYTQGALAVGYTQDDLEPAPQDVRSATFEQALSDLPLWSIGRAQELSQARSGVVFYGSPTSAYREPKRYSADEAQQYMAERGLAEQFTFDRSYNDDELRILADRKQKEMKRAYVLSRANPSFGTAAGRLGIQLATSFLDPLAVATAFVPVVGEARYGALLLKAGGALGRAGVRAGVGAAEGAVGAAIVEPIIYAAKAQEQADYTLADSMLNIGLGGVFGGGLHAVGGAVGDIGRAGREAAAQARVAEIRQAIARQAELDAPIPFTPLVEFERRLTVADVERNIDGLYNARRAELERVISTTTESDANLEFLFGTTRVEAAKEELARLDRAWNRASTTQERAKMFTGEDAPLWQSLVDAERADNLTAVEARIAELERARPAAYTKLQALERVEESQIAGTEGAREAAIRDANRELRKIDGELAQLQPVAATLNDQLKDSAKVRVLRAAPEVREAALGVTQAQAMAGEPIEVRPLFERDSWREASRRLSDPDQAEFANPAAVERADATLAEGETVDIAALESQVADLDARIKDIENEAKLMQDDAAVEYLAGIREQVTALEKEANDASGQARMLAVCAMRHSA